MRKHARHSAHFFQFSLDDANQWHCSHSMRWCRWGCGAIACAEPAYLPAV